LKKRSPKKPKVSPLHPAQAGSTSVLLVAAGDKARDLFGYALTSLGIGTKHFAILFRLANQGLLSQVELGQQMGIDRAPMVKYIDHLEQRGLVERSPNLQDRRAYALVLTGQGQDVLLQALALAHQVEAEVLAPLSAEEHAQLNYLMKRLLASHFINNNS